MNEKMLQPCPMCGELVSPETIVCGNCGELISSVPTPVIEESKSDAEQRFRMEIRRLAVFWFVFGLFSVGAGLPLLLRTMLVTTHNNPISVYYLEFAVYIGLGVFLLTVGLACWFRKEWSAITSLVFCYVCLTISLVTFNICGIILVIILIIQSHTVLRTRKQLIDFAISLNHS